MVLIGGDSKKNILNLNYAYMLFFYNIFFNFFIIDNWSSTKVYMLRKKEDTRLIEVAITDHLPFNTRERAILMDLGSIFILYLTSQ